MIVPGSANPLLLASAAAAGGLQVSRSLRFNASDSAYLSRTPAVAGNRKLWSWSAWIKKNRNGASYEYIFDAAATANFGFLLDCFYFYDNSVGLEYRRSTQVFRDNSAWYHFLVVFDSDNATAQNRLRIYANGVEITTWITNNAVSSGKETQINNTALHCLGGIQGYSYSSTYLADVHFIDGQALTPSSFTETDATTGQLIPKTYSGSYGTNGFNLLFADNSSNTASTLGKDTSGNGNNWTPNNLSVASGNGSYISGWSSTLFTSASFSGRVILSTSNVDGEWTIKTDGSGSATWTGSKAGITKLEFWMWSNLAVGDADGNYSTIGFAINGISVPKAGITGSPPGPSGSWLNVTPTLQSSATPSTLTSIRIGRNSANQVDLIGAIRINDTIILTDNSFSSGNDSLVDSPTNYGTDTGVGGEVRGNYCTLNPLQNGGLTLSNGNLDSARATSSFVAAVATIGMSSGKWYWEHTCRAAQDSANITAIGISTSNVVISTMPGFTGGNGWVYVSESGYKWFNGSGVSYGSTWTNGDVVGIAFDAEAGTLTFYKNGTSQGTAYTSLTSGPYFPIVSMYGTSTGSTNFGQRAFAYTAPSGFKALCTQNLPEGTITTSGTFTGNASADGPFVYLNGVPTAMTINSNVVTFATHADKLSNGFKLRTNNGSYNTAGSNTYSITTTGAKFKYARAQPNP